MMSGTQNVWLRGGVVWLLCRGERHARMGGSSAFVFAVLLVDGAMSYDVTDKAQWRGCDSCRAGRITGACWPGRRTCSRWLVRMRRSNTFRDSVFRDRHRARGR